MLTDTVHRIENKILIVYCKRERIDGGSYQRTSTPIRAESNETIVTPAQAPVRPVTKQATSERETAQTVPMRPIVWEDNQSATPTIPIIPTISNIQNDREDSNELNDQLKNHTDTFYNEERVYSININEELGIVEFETESGKKYQRNIQDIMDNQKDMYAKFGINQKCCDFTRNRIQARRLQRKLNPVIINALYDEEELNKYIECVNNTEKLWFNLEHNLMNSKLKGKDARLMKRAGKTEEKIGGKVERKKGLIERILNKLKNEDDPEKINEGIENLENSNEELKNDIEDNVSEPDKEKEMSPKGKHDFNRRYQNYANLARKLYKRKPRRNIEEIEKDEIDRELYELSSPNVLTRAIATLSVGKRLSKINTTEAKKYLNSALKQFSNKKLLGNSEEAIVYLEDTLISLRDIYLGQRDYSNAGTINKKYMQVIERERVERINPLMLQARNDKDVLGELYYWMQYRRKVVEGEKGQLRILLMGKQEFEAEELYRQILDDSGIALSPEEYDLSIKHNCMDSGEYIKIINGKPTKHVIIGDEGLSVKREQILSEKTSEQQEDNKKQQFKENKQGSTVEATRRESDDEKEIVDSEIEDDGEQKQEEIKGFFERMREKRENNRRIKQEQTKAEAERKAAEERAKAEAERKAAEERAKAEAERKAAEEQARIEAERKREEEKRDRIEGFKKRRDSYSVLSRGLFGQPGKNSIEEVNGNIVHKDLYDMTSEDELVKGIATYRTGHRLVDEPKKRQEAERLLKSAITILVKDEILSRDEEVIAILEDSHLDLGELYLESGEYAKAERAFADYMETVKREKVERYDLKINEARKDGKTIDVLDCWIEYRAKLTEGRKSMIRLLSKSGDKKRAEELYKKLLEDCKIALTDEEYQLSISSNCIEDGEYMRITQGRTYSRPILGNEALLLRRSKMVNEAVEKIRKKYSASSEKEIGEEK